MKRNVYKIKGKYPGKNIAVFAGVHGNEKAGIIALNRIMKNIKVEKGIVYFVFANPEAIKKNVRQINKNLNRCFLKNNREKSAEDKRARELMKILDECDALLDLHASTSRKSIPFVICEKNSFDLAKKMDFGIISFGWNKIEPGAADGYMHELKKPAFCLECGSVFGIKKNIQLAEKSTYQFLQHFGCIKKNVSIKKRKQKIIKVTKAVKKTSGKFFFLRELNDFDELKYKEIFASDGRKKYFAGKNELIIFPNAKIQIGSEAFIIGKEVEG